MQRVRSFKCEFNQFIGFPLYDLLITGTEKGPQNAILLDRPAIACHNLRLTTPHGTAWMFPTTFNRSMHVLSDDTKRDYFLHIVGK